MKSLTKWDPFGKGEPLDLWRFETPWNPFREMERELFSMADRMERLAGTWPVESAGEGLKLAEWTPRVDITEDAKEFLIQAELPEVKKEEIKVRVLDHTVSISGERKAEKEEKGRKFHRIERAYGSFERKFWLPEEADVDKISSEFKDGVLKVHLPKVPVPAVESKEVKVA